MAQEDEHRDRLRAKFESFALSRDPRLRDQLVDEYLSFAEHLARRFNNRGIPLEDLVQVASEGLLKAIDRFDPNLGHEFPSFAMPTIVGELKRHFRDRGWSIRVPRRIQKLHGDINTVIPTLTQHHGRSPTIAEIAQHLTTSEEEILEAMDAAQAYLPASLDSPMPGSDGGGLASRVGTVDVEFFKADDRMITEQMLDLLPKREQLVVRMRFYGEMSQDQIALRLNVSQMHISRLLQRSIKTLRENIEALTEEESSTSPP